MAVAGEEVMSDEITDAHLEEAGFTQFGQFGYWAHQELPVPVSRGMAEAVVRLVRDSFTKGMNEEHQAWLERPFDPDEQKAVAEFRWEDAKEW